MLDKQILVIHKFQQLFDILNEVETFLNFKLENINSDNIDEINNNKNYLIISTEKKLNFQNQIFIKEYPIDLYKLVEIININFLKNKFNQQNKIKIGVYFINLNSRMMSKLDNKLSLTEKEAKTLIFLNKVNKPTSIVDLQKNVWGHKSKLETHTVETHIYRLRKKIEKKFNDKSFISSHKGGYKINA